MAQVRELVTDRLRLRPYQGGDLDAVHRYASDARVTRWTDFGPNDVAASRAFLEMATRPRELSSDDFHFAIVMASEQRVVGGCSLEVTRREHRGGTFGYILDHAWWGKGIGTEAALALVQFAFSTLHLHRLEATCHLDNTASARVLAKAGLQLEGRMRDHMLVRGQWRDSLLFAILTSDR